jgi:hypothetical protein
MLMSVGYGRGRVDLKPRGQERDIRPLKLGGRQQQIEIGKRAKLGPDIP